MFTIRWRIGWTKARAYTFNLPHHVDMVWEQRAFDDPISSGKLNTAVKFQISRGDGMGNQTADFQITSPTSEKIQTP